jgi:hypothetical protein
VQKDGGGRASRRHHAACLDYPKTRPSIAQALGFGAPLEDRSEEDPSVLDALQEGEEAGVGVGEDEEEAKRRRQRETKGQCVKRGDVTCGEVASM